MGYNPYSLQGKTILVTGASSGIGQATAVECAKLGAQVLIVGRDEGRLEETLQMMPIESAKHQYYVVDLTKDEDVQTLIAEIPAIDGLVNNAGIAGKKSPVQFINSDELDKVLSTNAVAPILFTQKLLRAKKVNKNASIVFTSSIAGLHLSNSGNTMYAVSKNAVNAFMKGAALELAPKGIRCNTVNPGTVNTPMISGGSISEEARQIDKSTYPLKRYAAPRDVALGIVYLLSDASSYVTGTHLVIDGGRTLV